MHLDLRLYEEFEKDISDLLEKHAAEMVSGKAVDWPDYKFRSGYLKALRDALSVARDAQARVLGVVDKERN